MADSVTANLGLIKPDVGASDDTWGVKLNSNFDIIDNNVVSDAITDAVSDGNTYGRENGAWKKIPTITVASSAPSSPAVGDVWIDTT